MSFETALIESDMIGDEGLEASVPPASVRAIMEAPRSETSAPSSFTECRNTLLDLQQRIDALGRYL